MTTHPATPPATPPVDGRDLTPEERLALAQNPFTAAEVLTRLAADTYIPVRVAVASRTDLPADLLARLAHDRDVWVREAVALNPSTPTQTVIRLATDWVVSVRKQVASRRHIPEGAWTLLINDSSDVVLCVMADRPDLNETAAHELGKAYPDPRGLDKSPLTNTFPALLVLAANPAVSPARLRLITAQAVATEDEQLVAALLGNPSLPFSALLVLHRPVRVSGNDDLNTLFSTHPVLATVTAEEVLVMLNEDDDLLYARLVRLAEDKNTPCGARIADELTTIYKDLADVPFHLLLGIARHLPFTPVETVL